MDPDQYLKPNHISKMMTEGAFDQLPCCQDCLRMRALRVVLDKMPEAMRTKLFQMVYDRNIFWCMPSWEQDGEVRKLPHGAMIYLSPLLELHSQESVVGCVAHEIAHAVLDHLDRPKDECGEHTTEKEANEAVREWGFETELAAHDFEFKTLVPEEWVKVRTRLAEKRADLSVGQTPTGS